MRFPTKEEIGILWEENWVLHWQGNKFYKIHGGGIMRIETNEHLDQELERITKTRIGKELNPSYDKSEGKYPHPKNIRHSYKFLKDILVDGNISYNNLFIVGNRKIVLECDSPEDCKVADGSTINGYPIEVRKGAKWDDDMFQTDENGDLLPPHKKEYKSSVSISSGLLQYSDFTAKVVEALKNCGVNECRGMTINNNDKVLEISLHKDYHVNVNMVDLQTAIYASIPKGWGYTIQTYDEHITIGPRWDKPVRSIEGLPISGDKNSIEYWGDCGGIAVKRDFSLSTYRLGLLGEKIYTDDIEDMDYHLNWSKKTGAEMCSADEFKKNFEPKSEQDGFNYLLNRIKEIKAMDPKVWSEERRLNPGTLTITELYETLKQCDEEAYNKLLKEDEEEIKKIRAHIELMPDYHPSANHDSNKSQLEAYLKEHYILYHSVVVASSPYYHLILTIGDASKCPIKTGNTMRGSLITVVENYKENVEKSAQELAAEELVAELMENQSKDIAEQVDGYSPEHKITISLSLYHAINLVWLFRELNSHTILGNIANTGDWFGEVPYILEKALNLKPEDKVNSNCPPGDMLKRLMWAIEAKLTKKD